MLVWRKKLQMGEMVTFSRQGKGCLWRGKELELEALCLNCCKSTAVCGEHQHLQQGLRDSVGAALGCGLGAGEAQRVRR